MRLRKLFTMHTRQRFALFLHFVSIDTPEWLCASAVCNQGTETRPQPCSDLAINVVPSACPPTSTFAITYFLHFTTSTKLTASPSQVPVRCR